MICILKILQIIAKFILWIRNATLMLKKSEKLYETMERINSKIIDISVDKGMNKLLLTPASL